MVKMVPDKTGRFAERPHYSPEDLDRECERIVSAFLHKKRGDNGQFKIPLAPKFSASTNFDNYIAANTWTKVQFNNADSNDQSAFNGGNNNFTALFAGVHVFGFSLRFKANATVPTKVIATFYKNGAELGRGRAVSGAPVDDVTTYNLTVLTPLALNDVIDVRVNFATNDGYIESDQSHFWGHYVP